MYLEMWREENVVDATVGFILGVEKVHRTCLTHPVFGDSIRVD
jgi:hypothetical protein